MVAYSYLTALQLSYTSLNYLEGKRDLQINFLRLIIFYFDSFTNLNLLSEILRDLFSNANLSQKYAVIDTKTIRHLLPRPGWAPDIRGSC